jgi:hypothetical protein
VLTTVVVVLLVAAFGLVVGVAGWVVRRLWSATGDGGDTTTDVAATVPSSPVPSGPQED